MTPSAINRAVAEAVGWTWREVHNGIDGSSRMRLLPPSGEFDCDMPDYYGSLDDVHAAEKVLTEKQLGQFLMHLDAAVGGSSSDNPCMPHGWEDVVRCVTATAPQRCEALLRTLNLWTETPSPDGDGKE